MNTPPLTEILCDVDGVLADFVGMTLDYVQRTYGLRYLRSAIDQWDICTALSIPTLNTDMARDIGPQGLCSKIEPYAGAREFLSALELVAPVKIATSPFNIPWLGQRSEWLEKHMAVPLKRTIYVNAKADLARPGRLLIDDSDTHCTAFVAAGGLAFCIEQNWNTQCPGHIPRGNLADALAFAQSLVRAAA